jgi:hypothetical protein
MLFMTEYSVRPGCWKEAAERFLGGKGAPPDGVKLLGRWHNADMSGGYSLIETGDMAAAYAFAAEWSDILDQRTHPVIEDAAAGAGLAKRYAPAP